MRDPKPRENRSYQEYDTFEGNLSLRTDTVAVGSQYDG